MSDLIEEFHPIVADWFRRRFGTPTPAQTLGWPSISAGNNTLILAPTGSGKTLAAFLWAINHVVEQHLRGPLEAGVRILYISPLKALNNDIEKNLKAPLGGIREEARSRGLRLPPIRSAVRTGDTPAAQRAAMLKRPPDILITTPESLYLMLTAKRARPIFRTVQYVIVDEIHSVCGNKRGVHLSLSLERLQALADQEFVRIGLSATQRPLDTIAAFLGGQEWKDGRLLPRAVQAVDAGQKKEIDLSVLCPVPDFSILPQEGVWPLLFERIAELVCAHTTTLVFVNNRRLAERVAAKLNELLAGSSAVGPTNLYAVPVPIGSADVGGAVRQGDDSDDMVQAYHGSMSRQAREEMERKLKGGELRALVATSSLELGIDIGSIDLVIQLQSPKGIARGLQRVGRSGHLVSATSKGRILPTHREDLVESAVVAREMMRHRVEETVVPVNCLDVLAQQVVAMVSIQNFTVDGLYRLIRQSFCYRDLPESLYLHVLEMLGGKYTDEAFRGLNPRVSWDRINGVLRALPGSGRLAVVNGGTIADRGQYTVYLEDRTTKIGEVDEEFIHESRTGDTFVLGSSVWKMTSIDASKVTVTPAPGQPARMPFWRGEGIGRSFELGERVGEFRRELAARLQSDAALSWLRHEFPIEADAAWNILEYFRRQEEVTGCIPHDRLILVEGFRDEIGDPRIVVHSAFGRRVNGLLGLVLGRRLHELTEIEPQMLYNDDGILLRSSDADSLPLDLFSGLEPGRIEQLVLDEVLSSPLFGSQFRQNAARALLMPRRSPGKRTPLWLQRLRAGDLLQIVRRHDDFPIVIETVREVLNDVLDLRHFTELITGIRLGTIGVHTVQTEVPSPFSASLLFDFLSVYMYQADEPKADRFSRYLSINRELLSGIVDVESIASMIRPEAIEAAERRLQHLAEGTKARSPEELAELMLRLGDLTEEELVARCASDGAAMLRQLEEDGRAVVVDFPTGPRWIASEDAELYSKQRARVPEIAARYLRTHGPVSEAELAERYGLDEGSVGTSLRNLSDPSYVRGRFRPPRPEETAAEQWCYRPNLERIHRQTITLLRKEITPCSLSDFTRFLLRWQFLEPGSQADGPDALHHVLGRLEGFPLHAEIWLRDILGRRIRHFDPASLLQLGAAGSHVWIGCEGGRMKVVGRTNIGALVPHLSDETVAGLQVAARRILDYLNDRGASFLSDIRNGTRLSLGALNRGIADLFWHGLITNDLFSELQGIKRYTGGGDDVPLEPITIVDPHHNPMRSRILQSARRALRDTPGWSGRWSAVRAPGGEEELPDEQARATTQAALLLDRYGIVAREFHRREDLLPWPLLAMQLQSMEMRGEIRRGYFVEGLSGMQYALPVAVEQLRQTRSSRDATRETVLVHSSDPGNPFGAGVDWPLKGEASRVRISRNAGAYIAFHCGSPALIIEQFGRRIWTIGPSTEEILRDSLRRFADMIRLPSPVRPFREIVVEQCDGMKPLESPLSDAFRSLGFSRDRDQTVRLDSYR